MSHDNEGNLGQVEETRLEPAQPVPPEVSGIGRERFSLNRALKFGGLLFAGAFLLLEMILLSGLSPSNLDPYNAIRVTSGAFEISVILALVGGLAIGGYNRGWD